MLRRTCALATATLAPFMLATTEAEATAQRTFVASYGSATNTSFNCSITKPCRAFSDAVGVTNPGGEVIVLDSAGYGTVTITKSVSIIAAPGIYAGISVATGDGVTINAPGATVVLRGLSINGQGGNNGIAIASAATVRIENCAISNLTGAGIFHVAGALHVEETIVRDNASIGIWSMGAVLAALEHVRLEGNLDGVRAQNGAKVVVYDSVMSRNAHVGAFVFVDDTSAFTFLTVARSQMSFNQQGAQSRSIGPGPSVQAILTISDSTMSQNTLEGVLTTQDNGGYAAMYVRRTTVDSTDSGLDIHVSANTFALVDDDYFLGVRVEPGGTIDSRGNNTVSSAGVFGTLMHSSPF
jgi:hypothetical protein